MITLWLVVGLGVAVGVLALVTSRRRAGDSASDLGVVSHQWIAEQRFGHRSDGRR